MRAQYNTSGIIQVDLADGETLGAAAGPASIEVTKLDGLALWEALKASGIPIAPVVPVLTGASLLDVLSDGEAGAAGVKPRDLLRLAARSADIVPATNPKLARIIAKAAVVTPGLDYSTLIGRLPGTA